MLEKFLVLLERFVVAHELIAANSVKAESVGALTVDVSTIGVEAVKSAIEAAKIELKEEKPAAKAAPKKSTKKAAKPEPEDEDLADEPEPKKTAKKGVDIDALRKEIRQAAEDIAAGDSDDCADAFDDMLDEYGARNVGKLKDEDIEAFHAEMKELVSKYYDIED